MFKPHYRSKLRDALNSGLQGLFSDARQNLFRRRQEARPAGGARKMSAAEIDDLARRVIVPSLPTSDEERARATHQDAGQKLARQDRWADLSRRIRHADATRLTTPGGETASLLLAFGARSDVVAAAEDALSDGVVPDPAGIAALDEVSAEMPGDYACALVIALAHLDIAWAWHTQMFETAPEQSLTEASHHLESAARMLEPHDGAALDAPSLVAAQCALDAIRETRGRHLADDYARLIEMDPYGQRHMRAMGRHLLPFLASHPTIIEVEARRIALLTSDTWGKGGYAWVCLDALIGDERVMELLDPEFFIEAMRDILVHRRDQHTVNQFAAFCAISMAPRGAGTRLSRQAEETRAQLHACLDWVVADHMQELHPLIWSQTLLAADEYRMLPPRRALAVGGRQIALRIIATRFADQLADGSAIAFSPHGMYRLPAL